MQISHYQYLFQKYKPLLFRLFHRFSKLITVFRQFSKNVMQTIADNDLFGSKQTVVPRNLLKMNWFQSDIWSLTFYEDFRFCFFCDEKVNSLRRSVQFQFLFKDK